MENREEKSSIIFLTYFRIYQIPKVLNTEKMRMDTTPFPWELDIPVGILIFRLDFLLTKSRQARVALTSMDMVMELRSK